MTEVDGELDLEDLFRSDSSHRGIGFMDLADNSFSPGSRRLSIMTPQEFR